MTSKRRPRAALAAATVSCVLVIAGCGSTGDTSASVSGEGGSAAGEFEERGPITYAAGKDPTGTVQDRIDIWNTSHPDEKVTFIELPRDTDAQRQQMIQNAQIKSDAYTVISLDAVWTAEFAANRWVDELPADQFPLKDMLEPVVDTVTYRGGLYGVPETSDGGLLYYRKDLLKAAGIEEPPGTWAQMKKDCEQILKLPQAKGMSCYSGQLEKYEGLTVNFAEAVNSAGGIITDDNGKPDVNTPQAKKGLDFLVESIKDGTIPEEAVTYKEEEARQAYQSGKTVFMRNWPYAYGLLAQKNGSSKVAGKFDAAPLPGLDGLGSSSLGGHSAALSSSARNKGTAIDFMKFFTNEENARQFLKVAPAAPMYTAIYEDPELIKQYPYLPELEESIKRAVPRPRVVRYGETTRAIQDEVYAALTRRKSSDRALQDLQSELSELAGQ